MREQLELEVIKAEEARQLLSNKLFKEAFESTERDILEQMKSVKPQDERMHIRLVDAFKLLHRIEGHIKAIVETGKIAKFQLEEPSKIGRMFGRGNY